MYYYYYIVFVCYVNHYILYEPNAGYVDSGSGYNLIQPLYVLDYGVCLYMNLLPMHAIMQGMYVYINVCMTCVFSIKHS